jgi:hypothetical protein
MLNYACETYAFLTSALDGEMSGQLHASTALLLEAILSLPIR